ncbi:MAG: EsaB/YukD family protein [Lachnospiraceae bacterium]|nr:EsaB/YukD family protein [Lachnospiraceae bacterium]
MILVDIFVPSVDKTYDFQLNEEIEIHTVLEEISEMIGQKEHSRITGRVDQLLLCNYRTGSILSTNITLKEAGIVNGDKLLLV